MTDVGEMDTNLVLASGQRHNPQKGEVGSVVAKMPDPGNLRLCRCPVVTNAIFDGNSTAFILAQRLINECFVCGYAAMNDRPIFLRHVACFPDPAQRAGGFTVFSDDHNAACFAIEPVHEMNARRRP
jgi:hypothetical protein